MRVNVEIKLIKSNSSQDALRRAIGTFDPKVSVIAIFPGDIYKVETTLTIDQLRAIFGVESAAPVSKSVEVADIPCPVSPVSPVPAVSVLDDAL